MKKIKLFSLFVALVCAMSMWAGAVEYQYCYRINSISPSYPNVEDSYSMYGFNEPGELGSYDSWWKVEFAAYFDPDNDTYGLGDRIEDMYESYFGAAYDGSDAAKAKARTIPICRLYEKSGGVYGDPTNAGGPCYVVVTATVSNEFVIFCTASNKYVLSRNYRDEEAFVGGYNMDEDITTGLSEVDPAYDPAVIGSITAYEDPLNPGVFYSTFFASKSYQLPNDGTEAYEATIDGDKLVLTKFAENSDIIAGFSACILKSAHSAITLTPYDYFFPFPQYPSYYNALYGAPSATPAPANCYVLSGHSTDNSVIGVGFYQFSGTIPANKAYTVLSGGASFAPKRLRFVFNEENSTTGFDQVSSDQVQSTKFIRNGQLLIEKNGKTYNAQGQIVK